MGENEDLVYCLAGCARLDISASLDEESPVYFAASKGYTAALEMHLRRGAPTDYVIRSGRSVLQIAVSKGRSEVMQVLLAQGVSAETVNHQGQTPLMEAGTQ